MTTLTPKQKEIIELSKNLFFEHGFVETSVRDLAQHLSIKAASLYSHFNSKEEILQYICDEVYENMQKIIQEISTTNLSADEKFYEYVKAHITHVYSKNKESALYYKYWHIVDERVNRKYSLNNYQYFSFVDGVVKNVFPEKKGLPCYIQNATTLFMLDMMANVTKMINPEKPDIEKVVKDIHYRIVYGYGKGRKKQPK